MRSGASASTDRDAGFTFIEVLIAMLLIATISLGVAGLFGIAVRSVHAARNQTSATVLATQKMEQLRALTWGFDDSGQSLPVTDTSTDLSQLPATATGPGLNPSPAGVLEANTPGYVDYMNSRGQWVGTGTTPPATAVYIRRWAVVPLPTNPNNTIVLQVLVTTTRREASLASVSGPRRRYADDSLISSVKTRKAR